MEFSESFWLELLEDPELLVWVTTQFDTTFSAQSSD